MCGVEGSTWRNSLTAGTFTTWTHVFQSSITAHAVVELLVCDVNGSDVVFALRIASVGCLTIRKAACDCEALEAIQCARPCHCPLYTVNSDGGDQGRSWHEASIIAKLTVRTSNCLHWLLDLFF